jgi:hypothetical protein
VIVAAIPFYLDGNNGVVSRSGKYRFQPYHVGQTSKALELKFLDHLGRRWSGVMLNGESVIMCKRDECGKSQRERASGLRLRACLNQKTG